MKVNTRAVGAMALGIVAMAGCSSGKGSGAGTTTTALPRTSTTTRRREQHATTTTTTVPQSRPPSASASAVSASFVSPDHGWVLLDDGHLDETTDGGRRWHRLGNLPVHREAPRIRFIDAADGFAFGPDAGSPQFVVTHDGGATWTAVPGSPFSYIGDLEIARGMIYVTALGYNDYNFHIWESPVEHLVWKEVPPNLSNGAGPVPSQQIVLNAGKGWILNEDRTVVSGARLTSSTSWAAWTPPCRKVFGPAYLSASTGSDLAASCDEGEWGGNYSMVTPTFWISHDGGATFARHAAPAFGPVLMANPSTAIVVGEGEFRRTTDGGSSWHDVLGFDGTGGTPDYGFTTSTQGFVLLGHEMLMTYDAGATWQPVTLP